MTRQDSQFLLNLYEKAILKETKDRIIDLAKSDLNGLGYLIREKYPEEFI